MFKRAVGAIHASTNPYEYFHTIQGELKQCQ